MSSKRARKNHILPRKYLERFSKDNRIWVLDFETKKQNNIRLEEAAIIKDFYTVKTINSHEDDLIEQKFLAKIEEMCDPAIADVINRHSFSQKDAWDKLANYVALMYVRTPLFRQIFLETYEQFSSQMADGLIENEEFYNAMMKDLKEQNSNKKVLTYEEAKRNRDKFEISVDIPRTFYVCQMMLYASNLVPIIYKMTPNLFYARKYYDAKFVTGDVPIIPTPRKPTVSSTWINSPDCDLYFPLSSYCCLVLNYDSLSKSNEISSKRIAWINHLFACNCTRIILSEEQSFYWMKENRTISKNVYELVEAWGEEKKTMFKGARIDKKRPPRCRNDWGHLRSKDPEN